MAEDFMLDAWLTWMHQTSGRFHHISLHFGSIMLLLAPVAQEDRSAFAEGQYNVHAVLKEHAHFVGSLLRQGAPLAADGSQHLSTEFTREGNCIPAAIARINGNHETLRKELKKGGLGGVHNTKAKAEKVVCMKNARSCLGCT